MERYAEPGCSPRRRKPSPTLKVAGPQALTDEGQQANRTKPTPSNRDTFLFRFKIKLCHSSKSFKTVRLFPLIRPGLCPVHLPRRGRRPPGGGRRPPGGGRRPPGGGRRPPGGGRHPPGGGQSSWGKIRVALKRSPSTSSSSAPCWSSIMLWAMLSPKPLPS